MFFILESVALPLRQLQDCKSDLKKIECLKKSANSAITTARQAIKADGAKTKNNELFGNLIDFKKDLDHGLKSYRIFVDAIKGIRVASKTSKKLTSQMRKQLIQTLQEEEKEDTGDLINIMNIAIDDNLKN